MYKVASFIRPDGFVSSENCIAIFERTPLVEFLEKTSCRGEIDELLLDNVTNLWYPNGLTIELASIKEFLSPEGILTICDLDLILFANVLAGNFMSPADAAKALYSRNHVYHLAEIRYILVSLGYKIVFERLDKISFIIKASLNAN